MSIHLLVPPDAEALLMSVWKALESALPFEPILIHRSLGDVMQGPTLALMGVPFLVPVQTDEELDALLTASSFLMASRLILVLKDSHPEFVAKAHRLRPRVVFVEPVTEQEITSVVVKMLGAEHAYLHL